MCGYESEVLRLQLHLYARKRYPKLLFQPDRLQYILDEWDITSMRQLFDLPNEAKTAITLPLMIARTQDQQPLVDSRTRIAA